MQDPAFDKIIQALYGDVDQFDAEVGVCVCVCATRARVCVCVCVCESVCV
jgi:hypothetical protein